MFRRFSSNIFNVSSPRMYYHAVKLDRDKIPKYKSQLSDLGVCPKHLLIVDENRTDENGTVPLISQATSKPGYSYESFLLDENKNIIGENKPQHLLRFQQNKIRLDTQDYKYINNSEEYLNSHKESIDNNLNIVTDNSE